jgi:hypothetical protein
VVMPTIEAWDSELERLNAEQYEGFYWKSPIRLPAVGMRAIYEGQARFIQLQFLNGTRKQPLSSATWRHMGYLSGIYVEAFEAFLSLSDSEWPEQLHDPLVALFLLVCDLAINPTRGMPLDVETFENLILDVDVGVRFTRLCLAAKELPHLKEAINDYSRDEYVSVAGELTKTAGYDDPMQGLAAVVNWQDAAPGFAQLMEEYRTFEYTPINLPIRVFLSHFVSFYRDKFYCPEFFCWPGMYMAGERSNADTRELWLRHLSLFSDRGDKQGVYPRRWPNRSEKAIQDMANHFYGSMVLYDLTRQWLLKDGPFVCDFRWLSENYDQGQIEEWASDLFQKVYGVTLDKFVILQ